MSLTPLLEAPGAIPLHAFAAMAAFALGIVQFAAPKGTLPHRTIGWIWVLLMFAVAISSFWIHEIRLVGPFSPIHLLSIFAPIMLVLAVLHARRQCQRAQEGDDFDLLRRARHRRRVHLPARPDHARGGFRPLGGSAKRRFGHRLSGLEMPGPARPAGTASDPRKSMKKRTEKQPIRGASGWLSDPRCAI